MVHFLNAFWHGKETFPKSSSQNQIFPVLIVFRLPCGRYKCVKICFYSCRYQIKFFHSCLTRVVRVALLSPSCHQYNTRVTLVLHLCHTPVTRVSLVWLVLHSCCIPVARVTLVLLVSGTRVVNQTRSFVSTKRSQILKQNMNVFKHG